MSFQMKRKLTWDEWCDDNKKAWDAYFAAAIVQHAKATFAAKLADDMLEERAKRFPWESK